MTRTRHVRRGVLVVALLALLAASTTVSAPPIRAEIGYGQVAFMYPSGDPRSDEFHLATAEVDGWPRRVLSSQRAIGRPSYSPDGTRIAFSGPVGDGSLGRYGIYVINADGSGLRQITAPRYGDFDPAWSPDGSRIAFRRDTRGTTRQTNCCRLFVASANGANARAVPNGDNAAYPTWSPDGSRIAFSHPSGLRVVNADGSGLRTLYGGAVTQPAWSPDSRLIAFVRVYSPDRSELWTIPSEGGQARVRTAPHFQVESPSWAEDSRTIFFTGYRGRGYEGRTASAIWRVGGYGQLTHMATLGLHVYHLAYVPRINRVGDMPVAGDWDGIGGDGPGVARPADDGRLWWHLRQSVRGGTTASLEQYGSVGDTPIAGDWDGDGADAPGVVRRVGDQLQWHLRSGTSGPTYRTFTWGVASDIPVVGDWDGDGVDTPGVGRPEGGGMRWFLTDTFGSPYRTFFWGDRSDEPVVGDWNGDGRDDIGVARVIGNAWQWHVRGGSASGTTLRTFGYGVPSYGDMPITGDWNGDDRDGPGVTRLVTNDIQWHLLERYDSTSTTYFFTYGYH